MAPPPNAPRPPASHPGPGRNIGSEVAQLENLVRKLSEQVDRLQSTNGGSSTGLSDTQWWIIIALLLLILAVNALVLGLYWHRKGRYYHPKPTGNGVVPLGYSNGKASAPLETTTKNGTNQPAESGTMFYGPIDNMDFSGPISKLTLHGPVENLSFLGPTGQMFR